MKGITKPIDSYSRIGIPKETLAAIDVSPGDYVSITFGTSPDGLPALILNKYDPGCALCGTPLRVNHFIELNSKKICDDCVRTIVYIERKPL